MSAEGGGALGVRVAAAARALVGVPFRPQGRGPAGVDCVGLVLLALGAAGVRLSVMQDYPLRPNRVEEAERRLGALGLLRVNGRDVRPGDVVLTEPKPQLLHFMVATGDGVVEAHAGLRRVVERPWRPDEAVVSIWSVA